MRQVVVAAAIVLVLAAGCGGARTASKPVARTTSPGTPAAAKFADGIEGACLERNNELRQLSRPRTRAELTGYVASLVSIARYYRGQLVALHPAPRNRQTFARYVRLLHADETAALALLQAVRRGDERALAGLGARQRTRSRLERVLLGRLGVTCD